MPKDEIPLYDRILNRFFKTLKGEFISHAQFAHEFAVTRTVLNKNILLLQEEGNIIESDPEKGYRFIAKPDTWTMVDIQPNTRLLGRECFVTKERNTGQVLREEAEREALHGSIACTHKHIPETAIFPWTKFHGSLNMSILLRPNCTADNLPEFQKTALFSLSFALNKCGCPITEYGKYTLLLHGRKVGGIITESQFVQDKMKWAVISLGLNLNVPRSYFPAEYNQVSSLYAETERIFSGYQVLKYYLEELERKTDKLFPPAEE